MNLLTTTINQIKPIDMNLYAKTQIKLDNLTKPQGSLGRLEDFVKRIVSITGKLSPLWQNKLVFTLAADHGIVKEAISAYPAEVTSQMVYNFIRGGAAINVIANCVGAKVIVVDMGVASKLIVNSTEFRDKKINFGTKNFLREPAMTREEAIISMEQGIQLLLDEIPNGVDMVAVGDMGIGNTTSSSGIIAAVTGRRVNEVTGRGTGISNEMYQHKITVLEKALLLHKPNINDGLDILSKLGGFEIGGIAGIILAAVANRIPVVLDGLISTAGALIAHQLKPVINDYLFAGHCSHEPGHRIALDYLGLNPILCLDMRLGEGTGAAIALKILEISCRILNEMATFESAGVDRRDK